jgi:hypothetical protein
MSSIQINIFPHKVRRSFTHALVGGDVRGDAWQLSESVFADTSTTIPCI